MRKEAITPQFFYPRSKGRGSRVFIDGLLLLLEFMLYLGSVIPWHGSVTLEGERLSNKVFRPQDAYPIIKRPLE